jgi:predicted RecA/RadA family phage recombinase
MAKLFEKKAVSDHIYIDAFPATVEKGDLIRLGSLVGFADYNTPSGKAGTIDIGKYAAIFTALKTDLTGSAAIGVNVYLTAANALTTAAGAPETPNLLFGTIVAIGDATFDFAVI